MNRYTDKKAVMGMLYILQKTKVEKYRNRYKQIWYTAKNVEKK